MGRFPFARRDVMRQVYVRSPEREHALEYELVKREEPIELRRRSRAFLLAQSAEYDEGHSRRPRMLARQGTSQFINGLFVVQSHAVQSHA